ncbi:hypothetical protein C8J56DRAFT_1042832 [Mycena floridula]|nr:hypothetical protein C8J56DRAFT_1042832 [Mycena floridula]
MSQMLRQTLNADATPKRSMNALTEPQFTVAINPNVQANTAGDVNSNNNIRVTYFDIQHAQIMVAPMTSPNGSIGHSPEEPLESPEVAQKPNNPPKSITSTTASGSNSASGSGTRGIVASGSGNQRENNEGNSQDSSDSGNTTASSSNMAPQ